MGPPLLCNEFLTLAAILKFCIKRLSAFILEMVQDRVIWARFLTQRVYPESPVYFSKKCSAFLLGMMSFCVKSKNVFIWENVLDRVNLSKFWGWRVCGMASACLSKCLVWRVCGMASACFFVFFKKNWSAIFDGYLQFLNKSQKHI